MSENITPAYREEKLLANIAGEDYDVVAATREEKLLANIAGGDYDVVAATRKEKLLEEIAGSGLIRPEGSIEITENGTYDVTEYASAVVDTPVPTGTLQITENGTYNVAEYASAEVGVPTPKLSKVNVQNDLSDAISVMHSLKIRADGSIAYTATYSIDGETTGELYTSFGTTAYGCNGLIEIRVPASYSAGLNVSLSGDYQTVKEIARETSGNFVNIYLNIISISYTDATPTLRLYQ